MKVGIIAKTNQKGQVVIPQKMRKALGIGAGTVLNLILAGRGIYLYPVEEVVTKTEKESSYLKILARTQGSWKKEDWESLGRRRRKVELLASKKRKKKW